MKLGQDADMKDNVGLAIIKKAYAVLWPGYNLETLTSPYLKTGVQPCFPPCWLRITIVLTNAFFYLQYSQRLHKKVWMDTHPNQEERR
jgi:hypothetical protein